MKEIWKRIPRFKKYEASTHGRIRVAVAGKPKSSFPVGYILNPTPHYKNRYLSVMLIGSNGNRKRVLVHRIILLTFCGRPQKTQQSRHLNGIRNHNRLSNLAWGTPSENERDKRKHGTAQVGINNPMAKLNPAKVVKIKSLLADGKYQYDIAPIFGVTPGLISQIRRGVIWRNVP